MERGHATPIVFKLRCESKVHDIRKVQKSVAVMTSSKSSSKPSNGLDSHECTSYMPSLFI